MPQSIPEITYPSPRQIMVRRTLKHKGFLIGAAVLLIISITALLAPVLAP